MMLLSWAREKRSINIGRVYDLEVSTRSSDFNEASLQSRSQGDPNRDATGRFRSGLEMVFMGGLNNRVKLAVAIDEASQWTQQAKFVCE